MNILQDSNQLASLLSFHRKKSGLSQLRLADLAGVGKTVIYDLEHGKISVSNETSKSLL
ncbi:MAG: helix-turn-helix domain-containing protein [Deltaproteobacteria bacterium]|nr:helix-turn-helix domain-containing protein [Deltaproteobacteria bacterium]